MSNHLLSPLPRTHTREHLLQAQQILVLQISQLVGRPFTETYPQHHHPTTTTPFLLLDKHKYNSVIFFSFTEDRRSFALFNVFQKNSADVKRNKCFRFHRHSARHIV